MNHLKILLSFVGVLVLFNSQAQSQTPYERVKSYIQNIAAANPSTTRLIPIGPSDSGDLVWGLAIGNGPIHNLVVGTHHGNEYGATAVATGLAASLARDVLPNQTVFVVPVLNITGYNANERNEQAQNRAWLDANRDYPGPCGTSGPFHLKSTDSLARFVEAQNIVASATLHTFYPAVVYPWGLVTNDTRTPYDDIFLRLVQAATVESHYPVGNSTQVVYGANGTFEDFAFWRWGIWSILFEIGKSHSPSQSQVQNLIATNVPGLKRMLSIAPQTRAPNHNFTGVCSRRVVDLHKE